MLALSTRFEKMLLLRTSEIGICSISYHINSTHSIKIKIMNWERDKDKDGYRDGDCNSDMNEVEIGIMFEIEFEIVIGIRPNPLKSTMDKDMYIYRQYTIYLD